MRRILALIWLSLSLAIASAPAFAVPSPDCPKANSSHLAGSHMATGHDGMTADHEGMDCCAENCSPDCAAVCPGTVMRPEAAAVEPAEPMTAQHPAWASTPLRSATLAAADPPPRTITS